jgi:hypothetical protein
MAAKKATISATAKAKTNTGILHQVQDDGCFCGEEERTLRGVRAGG